MRNLSQDFIEKKREDANQASEAYIHSLYTLLQTIDMSAPGGPGKAHGILNMIEQIQKMHAALEKEDPSRDERKEAFKRADTFKDFFNDQFSQVK